MSRRENTIEALETIRRMLCEYFNDPCDCKYGLSRGNVLSDVHGVPSRGTAERTGCPEVREVIFLLKRLSDKQYEHLASRIGFLCGSDD
jgi:hypothetical protein